MIYSTGIVCYNFWGRSWGRSVCLSQLLIGRIPNSLYWHAYCVPLGFGKNCTLFLTCDGSFDVASTIGFHDIQSQFYQNMCLNLYRRPSGFWYVQGWLRWLHSPTAPHADNGSPNWMGWLQRLGVWSQKCECTVSKMSYWLETDCNMFIGYFASGADLMICNTLDHLCSKNVSFFKVCPHVQTLSHILLFSKSYLDTNMFLGTVPMY